MGKHRKNIEHYASSIALYWNTQAIKGEVVTLSFLCTICPRTMAKNFLAGLPPSFISGKPINAPGGKQKMIQVMVPAKNMTESEVKQFHLLGANQNHAKSAVARIQDTLPLHEEKQAKEEKEKPQEPTPPTQEKIPSGVGVRLVELLNQLIDLNTEILKSNRAQYRQLTALLDAWYGKEKKE